MGLCNSPDIFQKKMSTLVNALENVHAYIDHLLVLTTGIWDEYIQTLYVVLTRLQKAGLKVNAKNLSSGVIN